VRKLSPFPRHRTEISRAVSLLLVSVLFVSLALLVQGTTSRAQTSYTWQPQTVPLGSGALAAVSALDQSHAWAVGDGGTVISYNGASWRLDTRVTTKNLYAVCALDSTHVWAVGASGTVLFFNGTAWATQVSGSGSNLSGVSAADSRHVWAVATDGTIIFFNGTSWSAQVSHSTQWLTAVSAVDASAVWAVGMEGELVTWNGSTWTRGNPQNSHNLFAVGAVDRSHVWAGGVAPGGTGGAIMFFNGSIWGTQGFKTDGNIAGISAVDATHVWAVTTNGLVMSMSGTAWSSQGSAGTAMSGISSPDANHVWAVGGGHILYGAGYTPPGPHNFEPWICIQNPGTAAASVRLTYMKSDGSTVTDTLTVGPNSRSTVNPRSKLGDGVDFSTLVASTNGKPIIAERPMYFDYNGVWTGGHDVIGAVAPGPTFYFAEGTCRPDFDPYICIQDPGATDAAVRITYMKGDGSTVAQALTVKASSRSTVRVKDTLGEGDDAAHDFSAKVECTNSQLIIAERPMYFDYAGKWTGGHDVIGAAAPGPTFYFAEGTCRPSFDPYICIQNPGATDAKVSITYMKGNGATDTQAITVTKHSRYTVKVKDRLGEADDAAHDFSARVECTNAQSIIAERPMYFNYQGYTQLNWTGGHDVIGAAAPGPTFYFAEGTCRPNFDPYFCIQNPGSADAKVTITYMKGNGTTDAQSLVVAKHSRSTVKVSDRLGQADDTAHDFSAKVSCTNGQSIIAERPMYFNYQGYTRLNWTGGHDVVGALSPALSFYFAEGTTR
jgi:hypothetical protein